MIYLSPVGNVQRDAFDFMRRLCGFQLDQVEKILENLLTSPQDASDSLFDEEDEEEREKLAEYISRFKVCLISIK